MPTSEVSYVDANGLRFAYLEEGSGPLVLLLHGFPDTARSWDDLRPRLAARGYRAVSPWMRGYRPTEVPAADADLETLSRDVLALIEALGESSAIVIGHDWGAGAGYGAAALDPARISRLFVIAIPHPATLRPSPRQLWGGRHMVAYKLPGASRRFARDDFAALPVIYRRWSPKWAPPPEELAAVRETFSDPASLEAAFGYYRQIRFPPPRFLRQTIEVPTVAFLGLDDPLVGRGDYEAGRRMFRADYAIEEMRGGHFMHREHPDEFADKLLARL